MIFFLHCCFVFWGFGVHFTGVLPVFFFCQSPLTKLLNDGIFAAGARRPRPQDCGGLAAERGDR